MKNDTRIASRRKSSSVDPMNELRLQTAHKRLAESKDREETLEALREIVSTFVGSEEMALYSVEDGAEKFRCFWSFGTDLTNYDLQKALGDAGSRRVMSGECHFDFAPHNGAGRLALTQAFVPIRTAKRTLAILVIFQLLPQKTAFDKSDLELFNLLSIEVGNALFGRIPLRRGATAQK
jgi:GAF domain-containing protein